MGGLLDVVQNATHCALTGTISDWGEDCSVFCVQRSVDGDTGAQS